MSYADGEALALTAVRANGNFDSNNSARGDWYIRHNGQAVNYAVLKPGEYVRERHGLGGGRIHHYQTIIQVWRTYQGATDVTALIGVVDSLLATLDTYRVMGDTTGDIIEAYPGMVREMQEVIAEPGGEPVWIYVEIVWHWTEQEKVTFA